MLLECLCDERDRLGNMRTRRNLGDDPAVFYVDGDLGGDEGESRIGNRESRIGRGHIQNCYGGFVAAGFYAEDTNRFFHDDPCCLLLC